MRKPNVKNKYNLAFKDIGKLKIGDKSKICEPLFWRNDIIKAWCITDTTAKNSRDSIYGTYNSFWIGIYDEDTRQRKKVKVSCDSHGSMATYKFKKFFDYSEIENILDLEIQEKLLDKVNELIDNRILILD